jgi:hypothetical protein
MLKGVKMKVLKGIKIICAIFFALLTMNNFVLGQTIYSSDSDRAFRSQLTGNLWLWGAMYQTGDWAITENGVITPFYIKAGGNVGIGTTNPKSKLHVAGNYSQTTPEIFTVKSTAAIPGVGAGFIMETSRGTVESPFPSNVGDGNVIVSRMHNGTSYVDAGYLWFEKASNSNDALFRLRLRDANGTLQERLTVLPSGKLDVSGDIAAGNGFSVYSGAIRLYRDTGTGVSYLEDTQPEPYSGGWVFRTTENGSHAAYKFESAGNNLVTILSGGNVGIGTTNFGTSREYKLAVAGSIRAYEVIVETGWADFVFEDNYKLMPLEEVEKFVKKNKHLPDIPSEKEVKAKGLGLGEMQAKLLQKIEELTLYVIEQNKKLDGLQKEVNNLKTENESLKKQIAK